MINDYLAMAQEWWNNLQSRERVYLVAGSVTAIILFFWGLVWVPLASGIEKFETKIVKQQDDLQWMQKAARQILSAQGSQPGRRNTNQSLLALLEEKINGVGLKPALQRMNPDGANQVKFWLNAGNFDQLVKLFGELEQQNAVKVSNLSITSTEQPGLVDARIP